MPSPGVFAWSTEQHLQGFDGSPLVELSPGTVYYKDCNIYILYKNIYISYNPIFYRRFRCKVTLALGGGSVAGVCLH